MNSRTVLLGGLLTTWAVTAGQLSTVPAHAAERGSALARGSQRNDGTAKASPADSKDSDQGGLAGDLGPDVIVGALPAVQKWGNVAGVTAYSIATTSCNIGDEQLDWFQSTNQHPVIGQHIYRLRDGRFEQLGMSWVKHGLCALQETLCGPCSPVGGGCEVKLGIGCSDPYDTFLNGLQSGLGPRSQINASTGFFPYPPNPAPPAAAPTIGRRLQVLASDIDPSMNASAIYYGEGMYIHPDDAAAGNGLNNASYRLILVGSGNATVGWNLSFTGATTQQLPAIYAWQDNDASVMIEAADVVGDGRLLVGSRATDLGDGLWQYEFAVMNLNSHRSAGSFTVPIGAGVKLTDVGFHDVHHHSGEPFDTADWIATLASDSVTWATTPFGMNSNANALRWGTLFNFRFKADAPPAAVDVSIGLFRPGTPTSAAVAAIGPAGKSCGEADFNCDGVVDGADYGLMLAAWGTPVADLNGDGTTDGADLGVLLSLWG